MSRRRVELQGALLSCAALAFAAVCIAGLDQAPATLPVGRVAPLIDRPTISAPAPEPAAFVPSPATQEAAGDTLPDVAICTAEEEQTLATKVREHVPLRGLLPGSWEGLAFSWLLYGITTGRGREVDLADAEVDLVEILMVTAVGQLESLWLATGVALPDGTYHPMALPWEAESWSREEGRARFGRSGAGLWIQLVGLGGPEGIDWSRCLESAEAWPGDWLPPRVCRVGLSLEIASRGGSAEFLRSGRADGDWFLFGWGILPDGPDVALDLPSCRIEAAEGAGR